MSADQCQKHLTDISVFGYPSVFAVYSARSSPVICSVISRLRWNRLLDVASLHDFLLLYGIVTKPTFLQINEHCKSDLLPHGQILEE